LKYTKHIQKYICDGKNWNAFSILNAFLTYMSEKLTFVGRDDSQSPARNIFKVEFYSEVLLCKTTS